MNRYRQDVIFKKSDIIFLSNKNINFTRPYKKLDNKRYGPFRVKALMRSLYRIELSRIIRVYNVFYIKLLSLITINSLSR